MRKMDANLVIHRREDAAILSGIPLHGDAREGTTGRLQDAVGADGPLPAYAAALRK